MTIGDKVIKISKKPFKSGKQVETIVGFGTNPTDPKNRPCAQFSDGSVCNLEMMEVFKPNTLTELYNLNIDVHESWIPPTFIESFNEFMFGSTCYMIDNSDGTKEFCYYACDFRMWYNQNKKEIERDLKLEELITK